MVWWLGTHTGAPSATLAATTSVRRCNAGADEAPGRRGQRVGARLGSRGEARSSRGLGASACRRDSSHDHGERDTALRACGPGGASVHPGGAGYRGAAVVVTRQVAARKQRQ